MGNCLKSEKAATWVDDEEWESYESPRGYREGEEKVAFSSRGGRSNNGGAATEVKIKITKKQLEELLQRADAQALPIHAMLAHLMNAAASDDDRAPSAWRPALQSIPESPE